MKLVYPGWETPLVWRDGRFPLVVLEEPDYHFRIVQELCAAAGGADTAFVLSEGERLLDPARSLEVVLSPWSLVWDSRRIMTALYGRLKKECLRPELLGPAQEAAAAAARLAGRAGDCFSFPVVSEAGGDPMALLKALRLRPEPEEGPLAEQMLAYMTLHGPSRHGVLRFLRLPELPCGGRPAGAVPDGVSEALPFFPAGAVLPSYNRSRGAIYRGPGSLPDLLTGPSRQERQRR